MGCLRFGHKACFYRTQHRTDRTTTPRHVASPSIPTRASHVDATLVVVALQPVLVEQTELLRAEIRDCIARVGIVLASAKATFAKLHVASLLPETQIGYVDEEAYMYGDLSPRATPCSETGVEVVASVLQIMRELQKLCGEPTLPISMVLTKEMGSLGGTLAMSTATLPLLLEPRQLIAFVDRGGLDAAIVVPPMAVGQVASVDVELKLAHYFVGN
ncbi:hypothetical protein ZWY2020_033218 [Hordeum vulgare]|nr:hypothetical protein ZWY2020_033218 [Hordeum vulgare]